MITFVPTNAKILKWIDKNRAFWKFRVKFGGQKLIRFLWKWFSLMNIKLEEQLSTRSFSISFNFDQLYFVNSCLIFVHSLQNLSDSEGANSHLGLISRDGILYWPGVWFRKKGCSLVPNGLDMIANYLFAIIILKVRARWL